MIPFLPLQKGISFQPEISSNFSPTSCLPQPMDDSFWISTQLQQQLLCDSLDTKQETEKPPV